MGSNVQGIGREFTFNNQLYIPFAQDSKVKWINTADNSITTLEGTLYGSEIRGAESFAIGNNLGFMTIGKDYCNNDNILSLYKMDANGISLIKSFDLANAQFDNPISDITYDKYLDIITAVTNVESDAFLTQYKNSGIAAAIPEPAHYATALGALALAIAALRRRFSKSQIN